MEHRGISKLDLKRQNRLQILRVIRENGPISRVDIAAELELTRAAVTIITNEMIAQGVLQELGEAPIEPDKLQKGRRKVLIGINANYMFVLGANISDTCVSVGLTTLDAEVLDKSMMNVTEETSVQEITDFIIKSSKDMIANSCLGISKILGLGIGILPLMWERMGAKVEDGHVVCEKLVKAAQEVLTIPVLCANSIGLLALATQDFGEMHGRRLNQVLIAAGEQYNIAVLNDNALLRDFRINTSCVENFIVRPNGAKYPGYPDGSVKAEMAASVVIGKIRAVYSKDATPHLFELTGGDADKIAKEVINDAYEMGDQPVVEVMNDVLDNLALLTCNLMCTHFADKVVLQNFRMSEHCFAYFKQKLAELTGQPDVGDRIEFSRADRRYSFLGGCSLAIYKLFYYRGGMLPRK